MLNDNGMLSIQHESIDDIRTFIHALMFTSRNWGYVANKCSPSKVDYCLVCGKQLNFQAKMSFAAPKTVIQENDTVILYLTVQSLHAIDVVPFIKNKKDELIENVFQTTYGALKIKDLIGIKYGSKVTSIDIMWINWNFNYKIKWIHFRFKWQKVGAMCCNQRQNYGHRPCHIERKSFTHPT